MTKSSQSNISYTLMSSPVGPLLIAATNDAIVAVRFDTDHGRVVAPGSGWTRDDSHPLLAAAIAQLREYFAGERTEFNLPLDMEGTDFQKKCWAGLCEIPYGETISYGELARRVGNANASRAVGMANGRNPIAIIVPCHRVIGANGTMTGFGGGIETKQKLLAIEGLSSAALFNSKRELASVG